MKVKAFFGEDEKIMEFSKGTTYLKMIEEYDKSLRKKALAVEINGHVEDLMTSCENYTEFKILTAADEKGLSTLRHTCSHVMAQAIKRLWPETKLAIGPSIKDGFYYDIDTVEPISSEDFEAITKEMENIIRENLPLERFEMSREDAIKFFTEKNETYKVELINDLPKDAVISCYKQGEFTDLCAGPHVPSTGYIKAFKLMSLAGAYWRGSEKNKMLQRVYATAYFDKKDLQDYLTLLEEAKKRDHRKLGQELELFTIMDEGPGFPFFFPKGMVLRNQLMNYWREIHQKAGYDEIMTPIILNRALWERSGHWFHYKENMYTTIIDDEDYAIKPMNCPGSILIYNSKLHSYRDFPIRLGEVGTVHRHELSGALHGLMRVRCFTQDDAHIYMLPEQIKDEIVGVIKLIDGIYSKFGFNYHMELSTMPEDHLGDIETWHKAETALANALTEVGAKYVINEGDGAFYGPKIDFHLTDSLGRTWQCGTIQLDFQLPERFDMTYIGEDGEKHRPVMIHRTAFGSVERFIGILTEHYAGAFPTWLSPVQVKVIPITENQHEYADAVLEKLNEVGIRAEIDKRNEKMGYKIREAQSMRIPYMLIIGDKEMEAGKVAVRYRKDGDKGQFDLADVIAEIQDKNKNRTND